MAKGKISTPVVREQPKNGSAPVYFTTSTGIKVKIVGCPPLFLDRVRSSVEYPDKPTYEVETATGEMEIHEHNDSTLQTDEDKAMWAAYKAAFLAAESEVNERMFRAVVMRGMEVSIPEDGSWEAFQKWLGVDVPDDPFDKKYLYIQSEVIGSDKDIAEIMSLVMEKTGVPEETVREVRESFRDSLEEANSTAEDEGAGK